MKASDPVSYLSRRGFMITGGLAISAVRGLPATPACTLTSEQEEGPYYIDDETLRRDITEGRPGIPVMLNIRLLDAKTCLPIENAALDIWHCDATGVYSGFTENSPDGGRGGGRQGGPPPGPPQGNGFIPGMPPPGFGGGGPGERGSRVTDKTRFLRGVQLTDKGGLAGFSTLYPGWYSGRAIHIHLKVHIGGTAADKYSGGHVAHTGQLFFPEDITERISQLEPYVKRLSVHRTTQDEDGIFQSQHGAEGMVSIERLQKASDAGGFRATVTLAVDRESVPTPVGGFGGRGFRGRGPGGPPQLL